MFETIGLKKDDTLYETWYGKIEGIYFTIEETLEDSTSVYALKSDYISSGLLGSVLDFVEQSKREKQDFIQSYSITAEALCINFEKKENTYDIEFFIKELVQKLQNIEIKNTCVHCGRTNNLFFYKHIKGISVMCETCGDNLKNKITVEQNVKNHYFRGFIGSLIGALIGSVLWIVLGLIGWVASFAGYAIAFGSFYGYKKMKGKMNKKGVIINIVTIIIAFILANYLGLYFAVVKDFNWNFAEFPFLFYVLMTPVIFTTKEILMSLLKDLLIGVLFLGLGISSTIRNSFNEAKIMENMKVEKLDGEKEIQEVENEVTEDGI